MKLIVIIPAYNEEKTIAEVIKRIPRDIKDIERVEALVIDDGSTDNTNKTARDGGANYIISNPSNRGLAYSFKKGLDEALKLGADIIVNIDADLQHNPAEIPKLIQPILGKKAEMVIGIRQFKELKQMDFAKRYGNIMLSLALSLLLKNRIRDATSGFRAYSRECALRINILSEKTYTHETIIQCVFKKMSIAEVAIESREREWGESKLIKSLWDYIKLAVATITRVYFMYAPLKTFFKLGILIVSIGLFFEVRYLWLFYLVEEQKGGHLPSIIFGITLIIIGILIVTMGFLADLIDANRKKEEEILYRLRKKDYEKRL